MLGFLQKHPKKFDRKTLRRNDISLLILDGRWNSLFENTERTPEIIRYEAELKELLKQQARWIAESKEIQGMKKRCLDKIMQLTSEVYEKGNEQARTEMQDCEKEIIRINERLVKIEEELENIPDRIREVNLQLLENVVNVVYLKIAKNRKRIGELDQLIEATREKLKEYIDEKETLAESGDGIYTYFHDLLGGEELEKLDREYLKK